MTNPDESPSGFQRSDATSAWPGTGFDLPGHKAPAPTPRFRELAANHAAPSRPASQPTIFQSNRTVLTTLAVVAAYVALALSTGVVLLGIFPVALALRAFRRHEPFAPLAIVAAAGAVIFSLAVISHH
jgi:hypothetical protein